MQDSATINGIIYLSNSALTHGDYGGSGSVGVANVRTIQEHASENELEVCNHSFSEWQSWREGLDVTEYVGAYFRGPGGRWTVVTPPTAPVIELYGGYGSVQIWVRADNEELKGMLDALEDYPLIDDDAHSEIEMDWESEAFDDYARADLTSGLSDDLETLVEAMTSDEVFSVYRQAMESCNEYPTPEHSGMHIPVDAIKDTFVELLEERKGVTS